MYRSAAPVDSAPQFDPYGVDPAVFDDTVTLDHSELAHAEARFHAHPASGYPRPVFQVARAGQVVPPSPEGAYGAPVTPGGPLAGSLVRRRPGLLLAGLALVALVALAVLAVGVAVLVPDHGEVRSATAVQAAPLAGYDLGAAVAGSGDEGREAVVSPTAPSGGSLPSNPVPTNPPAPTTAPPATVPPATVPPATVPPATVPPTTQPQPKNPLITNVTAPSQVDCSDPMNQTPYLTIAWQTKNTDKVVLSIDGPGPYQTYAGGNGSASVPFACEGPHTYMITASGPNGPAAVTTLTVKAKP